MLKTTDVHSYICSQPAKDYNFKLVSVQCNTESGLGSYLVAIQQLPLKHQL